MSDYSIMGPADGKKRPTVISVKASKKRTRTKRNSPSSYTYDMLHFECDDIVDEDILSNIIKISIKAESTSIEMNLTLDKVESFQILEDAIQFKCIFKSSYEDEATNKIDQFNNDDLIISIDYSDSFPTKSSSLKLTKE